MNDNLFNLELKFYHIYFNINYYNSTGTNIYIFIYYLLYII